MYLRAAFKLKGTDPTQENTYRCSIQCILGCSGELNALIRFVLGVQTGFLIRSGQVGG